MIIIWAEIWNTGGKLVGKMAFDTVKASFEGIKMNKAFLQFSLVFR